MAREIRDLRQVKVRETGDVITVDSDTFNPEWHAEMNESLDDSDAVVDAAVAAAKAAGDVKRDGSGA